MESSHLPTVYKTVALTVELHALYLRHQTIFLTIELYYPALKKITVRNITIWL